MTNSTDDSLDAPLRALFARAADSQEHGHLEDAVKGWRAILLGNPDYLPALDNLAKVLRRLGRIAESDAVLRTALERHPTAAALYINQAHNLMQWGREADALQSAERAAALAPEDPDTHDALARLHLEFDNRPAARAALERAVTFSPDHVASLTLLGRLLRQEGDPDRAVAHLDKAVGAAPKNAHAQVQRALALLAAGRLKDGFRAYDWRWRTGVLPPIHEGLPAGCQPWTGAPLEGRTLLIRAEQGMSECLQFFRLAGLIKDGRVVVEAPEPLVPLLRAARRADEVIPQGAALPKADCWAPMLSLPRIMGIDHDSVPDDVPYLRADPSRLAPWRMRLGEGLKIGIAWHGGEPAFEDRHRAVPLAAFEPLMRLPGVKLVSLQKGEGRQEVDEVPFPVHDYDTELDEGDGAFLDSAAAAMGCAVVVAADTAIAHLAGALGRPTLVALPEGGDWRFGWHPSESAWYPTMELVRKPHGADWTAVFEHIARRLEEVGAPP